MFKAVLREKYKENRTERRVFFKGFLSFWLKVVVREIIRKYRNIGPCFKPPNMDLGNGLSKEIR